MRTTTSWSPKRATITCTSSLLLLLGLTGIIVTTPGASGSDSWPAKTNGGWATAEALQRDSDGDGWSDWIERLKGTDPNDSGSHPDSGVVDILGTTGIVQSVAFPDQFAMVDLGAHSGLIGKDGTANVLDLVATLGGLTPGGKLHSQLTQTLAALEGAGGLESLLAAANAAIGPKGGPGPFDPKTNGLTMSLVSMDWGTVKTIMDGVKIAQSNRIEFGTTTNGDPFIRASNLEGSQQHVYTGHGIETIVFDTQTLTDGTVVQHWITFVNGVEDGRGKRVTRADGTWEHWVYDGSGKLISHNSGKVGPVGPASSSAPSADPSAPASSASASASAGSSSSGQASASPTSEPSEDESESPYVDPDATPPRLPTEKEFAERAEFLGGLLIYTARNKPESPSTPLLPKPGVADPAEPECSQPQCLAFVEIIQPDLHNRPGGDPIRPGFVQLPLGLPPG